MKPDLEHLLADALEGVPPPPGAVDNVWEEEYMALAQQDRMIAMQVASDDEFVKRVMSRLPSRRSSLMTAWKVALALSAAALALFALHLYRTRSQPAVVPQVRTEIPEPTPRPPEPQPPVPPPPSPPPPVPRPIPPENPPQAQPPPPPPAPPPTEKPPPPSRAVAESFKLGVVNLKVCFEKEKYDRIKQIDLELQKKSEEYLRKLQDIDRRLVELKDQTESLPRDTALRAEKVLLYRRLETERKFEQEYGRAKYLEYYSDKKIEIYNEIRRVVAMIAQEQKFDLILRVEAPLLEEQDPETVIQRINNRVVLYSHEGVDITPLVVKRLNDEWAIQKARPEWECPVCHKRNRGETCSASPGCTGRRP